MTVVVRLPAPADEAIYLATDRHGWRPDGVRCERTGPAEARAVLRLPVGTALSFKATRGSWATVEKAADGREIPNRRVRVEGDTVVTIAVAAWADKAPPRPSTATGDIRIVPFASRILGETRTLRIYFPPGYESAATRCPVLYMHDGQNLFDEATSFAGMEWQVDETLERMIPAGEVPPLLVVGVDNAGARRMYEYTPTPGPNGAGGGAETYARFLVEELKPYLDATYRTDPARAAVAGSSLGGLLSLYLFVEYPETFPRAAALSPSLWWDGGAILERLRDAELREGMRLWADIGTAEGEEAVRGVRELEAILRKKGLSEDRDFAVRIVPDATHDEAAWAARFPDAVRFLFGP